jgi:hypothetical protein
MKTLYLIFALGFMGFSMDVCSSSSSSVSSLHMNSSANSSTHSSLAQSSGATSSQSSGIKTRDNEISVGDKISFPVNVVGSLVNGKGEITDDREICIPAKINLRVTSISEPQKIFVTAARNWGKYGEDCNAARQTLEGVPIALNRDITTKFSNSRNGFTYGGIIVPYKYHFNGSKSFEGGTTLAPYAGYRFDRYGLAYGLKIIGFAGLTKIDVVQTIDNEQVSQSLSGFSYGVGAIGSIDDAIQIGLVIGADRVNESSGYIDNGKPWISLAIGYSFAK